MKLTQQLKFNGCKLRIMDAEGHDMALLHSMLAYCKERLWCGFCEWPHMIQFETMDHCNNMEGFGAELGIITALEADNYVLVHYSNYNSYLAPQ